MPSSLIPPSHLNRIGRNLQNVHMLHTSPSSCKSCLAWDCLKRSNPQILPEAGCSFPLERSGPQAKALLERSAPSSSYVFLLNLPSVFLLIEGLLLTCPNFFHTLPPAETSFKRSIRVTVLNPVTCSSCPAPQVPLRWDAPEVKRS